MKQKYKQSSPSLEDVGRMAKQMTVTQNGYFIFLIQGINRPVSVNSETSHNLPTITSANASKILEIKNNVPTIAPERQEHSYNKSSRNY